MNDLKPFDPFAIDPFEESLRAWWRPWRTTDMPVAPRIRLDVVEQADRYAVKAEIPGVDKDAIDVRVDGHAVTISAEVKTEKEEKDGGRVLRRERQQGCASRSFTLASAVDEARVQARYEAGVLHLTLPKKAAAATRRIAVT